MAHGGDILVKALAAHGVKRLSCVAGESYLPVLDALLEYPDINVVTCRHESGASFMAEGWGQLDPSHPGVAFVTRAPGACNASIGIHSAMQSSTPLVLFVGLVSTQDRHKEAFQEFDLPQMYATHSKWTAVIDNAERIPNYVARAFHMSMSGRPGPVVLGLPEDILFPEVKSAPEVKPYNSSPCEPGADDLDQLYRQLIAARQPAVLVGGGGWSAQACADLEKFAENFDLPITAAFRRQDIFNHRHKNYIGELGTGANPQLVERIRDADLVLVLNARPDEITTQGYTLFKDVQKIIHVHPSSDEFGKGCNPTLAIQSHMAPCMKALAAKDALDKPKWTGWRSNARKEYEDWTAISAPENWKGADMTQIFGYLRDAVEEDSILISDVGNFSGWMQRYIRYGRPGRLLASIAGAMGNGVPMAVGASLAQPEKQVICVCGDGGFMMTGHELATAAQHGAKPIVIVCNNGLYGTIRMHQEKTYPGRHSATDLANPDFVKLGESYGAFSARVEKAEDFEAAFVAAKKSGKAALIEIRMDPRQITTRARL